MKKMFENNYNPGHSAIPAHGLVPELLACRACLATDTKLYTLEGTLRETYEYLMAMPLTTNVVRSVDRVTHKLLLKFTLGIDSKIIHMIHEDDQAKKAKTIDNDDTDALTDVLDDFEEITKTLNDDVNLDLNEDEFDVNDGPFIDRARNFNVEELFRGKGLNNDSNDISSKNISNDLGDIISRAFKGKDKCVNKSIENVNFAVKKAINEDTSSTFRDAEDVFKANLNDLTADIAFNDISINTHDLNDTDSNLVDAFNNFILDHDYLDEKFLLESGDSEFMKKHVISKKADEDSLLKEIIPNMTKKDKKLIKEREPYVKHKSKPIKNLSKLKEINRRAKLDIKTETNYKSNKKKAVKDDDESSKTDDEKSDSKPIVIKPELPIDDAIKSEMSKEFIKFGADFNFRIFELSTEEQMEELQKKREGELYVGSPYKCADCAKGFRSAETYGNHMKVHDPSRGEFACHICRTRHPSAARRRRHADTHRLKYCCTQCEFVARTRERAEQHFQWHAGKTYSCQYCGEQFGCTSTHLSHVRLQHADACAACALCGEAFIGALGLRQHARRAHPATIKNEESVEWYCFSCRVQFQNEEAFQRHKAVASACHSKLRPCASCGDSFDTEAALLQHRRRSHSDAPVQCHACSAWFCSAHSRQTHYERAHLRVRARAPPPPAPAHPAPARRRAPRGKPAMCELCGNNYHSAAALSYHQRTHTGERPFACSLCPKTFTLNHSLQAHLRTHTGERPHRCPICSRAFPNANNLARHKNIVHLGQRQYARCAVCRRWLSSPAAARAHAARLHAGAAPPPAPYPSFSLSKAN